MPARSLTVHPGPPLSGRLRPPGDKSITHRAYLFGLLAEGETVVEGANPGRDCRATLRCVAALGARVRIEPATVRLQGTAGALVEPDAVLDCANSGTTLRLVAGLVAPSPLLAVLAGDDSLNRRPVDRVVEPLRLMGARLRARAGDRLPPLVIEGGPLEAIHYRLPMASAQVATCVLLAGLGARGETTVEMPGQARDHTERMLPAFGVEIRVVPAPGDLREGVGHLRGVPALSGGRGPQVSVVGPARLRATRVRVPGDFSAAAFFLAAAAATPGASVTAEGVSLNPTRTGLLDVLERMGAHVGRASLRVEAGEPVGDVTVTGPAHLEPCVVPAEWIPRLLDEIPAWLVAATAAAGMSRLTGAAELRVKESDRLHVMATGLRTLGVEVEESPDGLVVTGGVVRGGSVAVHHDHRIAMAFAVLGTRASGRVTVDDAASIATSYPDFIDDLRSLGGLVEVEPLPGGGA